MLSLAEDLLFWPSLEFSGWLWLGHVHAYHHSRLFKNMSHSSYYIWFTFSSLDSRMQSSGVSFILTLPFMRSWSFLFFYLHLVGKGIHCRSLISFFLLDNDVKLSVLFCHEKKKSRLTLFFISFLFSLFSFLSFLFSLLSSLLSLSSFWRVDVT